LLEKVPDKIKTYFGGKKVNVPFYKSMRKFTLIKIFNFNMVMKNNNCIIFFFIINNLKKNENELKKLVLDVDLKNIFVVVI